jgi:hypothetical protein
MGKMRDDEGDIEAMAECFKPRDRVYLVYYAMGKYEDYHEVEIFITSDEAVAATYKERFNALLDRLRVANRSSDSPPNIERMWRVDEVYECRYREIEVRN